MLSIVEFLDISWYIKEYNYKKISLFYNLQFGYTLPDRKNEDAFYHDTHIQPLLNGTDFFLHKVQSDWPILYTFR